MDGRKVLVVGGGLVGLATAYRLLEKWPGAKLTLLEKEPSVGQHQSGHNSGVLHCGLNYKPGSSRARLAVTGVRQMIAFCQRHSIQHEICGKLVVAPAEDDVPRLRFLLDRGTQNGLRGLRLLGREEMREIEPHCGGAGALRVPEEGITDYPAVSAKLAALLGSAGARVVTGAEVRTLRQAGGGWVAETTAGAFGGDFLIVCAGLHADRLAALAGEKLDIRIVPFRGDYYKLKPASQHLVRNLIYPLPDPKFPFLGVHFTRLARGGIEAGPNASLAFAREGYNKTEVNWRDLAGSLSFPGLWNFVRRHPGMCRDEMGRTFSKGLFLAALRRLVPAVTADDLEAGGAGIRAQAMHPDGALVDDFLFVRRANALHVLNAPSPAATASLAIGSEIASLLES